MFFGIILEKKRRRSERAFLGLCLVFSFMFLTFSPQELPLFAAFGRIVGIFLSFRRPSAFFRTKKSQQSGLRPQIKAVPSGIRSKKCPKKLDSVPKKPVPTSVSFFLELFQKTYHFCLTECFEILSPKKM